MSAPAEVAVAPRARVGIPTRVMVALALALAAVGFGLIVAGAWALGYGHDLHAIRVAGTLGVLIAAMLLMLWPGRSPSRRLLAAASGLLLAAVAWFLIPAGLAGRSLLSAGTERELISVWLGKLQPVDVAALPQLRERVEALSADYPSLSAGLGRKVDDKIEKAIEARVAELGHLSATDTAGFARGAELRRSVVALFPDARPRLVDAERKWGTRMTHWLATLPPDDVEPLPGIQKTIESLATDHPTFCEEARAAVNRKIAEAVGVRVAELREMSAADSAEFAKSAPARRALVKASPAAKPQLVAAEEKWATRWAGFTAVAYTHADMLSPKHVREGCRASEQQLREMPTLDDSATRLLKARRVFFQAAHESAVGEIRALHEAERFERAFGVALAHGFDWSQVPGLLGPDEQKGVADLREQCRALLQPGGDPEAIPPPRAIETAPLPRPK